MDVTNDNVILSIVMILRKIAIPSGLGRDDSSVNAEDAMKRYIHQQNYEGAGNREEALMIDN